MPTLLFIYNTIISKTQNLGIYIYLFVYMFNVHTQYVLQFSLFFPVHVHVRMNTGSKIHLYSLIENIKNSSFDISMYYFVFTLYYFIDIML